MDQFFSQRYKTSITNCESWLQSNVKLDVTLPSSSAPKATINLPDLSQPPPPILKSTTTTTTSSNISIANIQPPLPPPVPPPPSIPTPVPPPPTMLNSTNLNTPKSLANNTTSSLSSSSSTSVGRTTFPSSFNINSLRSSLGITNMKQQKSSSSNLQSAKDKEKERTRRGLPKIRPNHLCSMILLNNNGLNYLFSV